MSFFFLNCFFFPFTLEVTVSFCVPEIRFFLMAASSWLLVLLSRSLTVVITAST